MPELPEVETVANQLAPILKNQKILDLTIVDKKLSQLNSKKITGKKIKNVFRSGKQVAIALDEGYLVVHLRMTGRLIWCTKKDTPPKKFRAQITLKKGNLYFSDTRRFGRIEQLKELPELEGLDPFNKKFTAKNILELLSNSKQPIKPWLLRQDKIVGLGNIYASEILFASSIHPETPTGDLSLEQCKLLRHHTLRILKKSIKNCGTTFSDFQTTTGSVGNFGKYLKVYGKAGLPCARCKTPIERLVQAGRSSFFCPNCQKMLGC